MKRSLRAFALVSSVASLANAAPRIRLERLPIKPNDVVELDGGEKVSAARYNQELSQLQEALEAEGISMRKSDKRPPRGVLPFSKDAEKDKERDKAALAAQIQRLDVLERSGFAALRKKRKPRPGTAVVRDHRALAPLDASSSPGADGDDALDVTFEQSLGNKKRAAIYLGIALRDTGETDKVGCDASVDGGVYLFDEKKQLAKMAANGNIAGGAVSGGVDLFLLGKAVGGFPKKGSQNVNTSKAIAPPAAKLKYGWGPISINITGSIAGELRLVAQNQMTPANATSSGRCTVSVEPMLRASAKATASVSAVAYKVGVEGQIVLLDVKTPMASSIIVQKNPPSMTEDFRASVNATFLDGDVFLYVKTRIPQKGERFWDLDWDQVYKKNLFDWDGLRLNKTLASFKGKQTAL